MRGMLLLAAVILAGLASVGCRASGEVGSAGKVRPIHAVEICCDATGGDGLAACNGSSSCKVCTNCSRCKHCKGGGSCGVCAKK